MAASRRIPLLSWSNLSTLKTVVAFWGIQWNKVRVKLRNECPSPLRYLDVPL